MSLEAVKREFERRFGGEPELVTAAPGRVNLIGEHTDYNEGFVLPAAIDRFVWVAASRASESAFCSLEFDAKGDSDGLDWKAYPKGVEWALRERGLSPTPLQAVVSGNVPIGAGVSSSAAIEMAFATAWNELDAFHLPALELAKIGQRCENGFIGLRTGLMDQMASACGREGHALLFDTLSFDIEAVPIPAELTIVVADTCTSRQLAESKYNERRAECEQAAHLLDVRALRHARLGELEDAADLMPDTVYRRARHVITENARCRLYADALLAGDLAELGRLMTLSHESLRLDYEVSCPQLDAMAEACRSAAGCVGARMTGAGFGGCCVALVKSGDLDEFLAEAAPRYRQASGIEGRFLACKAAAGARRVA